MLQNRLAELNELKQRRSKIEQEMNMKMKQYHEKLRRLDHEIAELNETIQLEKAAERGTDRTVNWNRELEGTWSVEGETEDKLYEREYVYDSAHRK